MGDNKDDEMDNAVWHSKSWGVEDRLAYVLCAKECSS